MSYDSALVKKVMFRPKNHQIELHLGLSTNNPNYDRSKVGRYCIYVYIADSKGLSLEIDLAFHEMMDRHG